MEEDEGPPPGVKLKKRKRFVSDGEATVKRRRSKYKAGESSRKGRLRRAGDFVFKGNKSKFAIRPVGHEAAERLVWEVNISYSSSEDEVLTDDETGPRRAWYGFLFRQGSGSFTVYLMTHDDFKKLTKHSWTKMARHAQKYHAKVLVLLCTYGLSVVLSLEFCAGVVLRCRCLGQGEAFRLENKTLRSKIACEEEYK